MSDNKLRCALVFRLESGPPVSATLLAKYDHASQYETHGGTSADSGTLYGGRDKNYADAVGMVVGNDPPGKSQEPGVLGGFKVVQSEVHQVVYGADTDGLCLSVITGLQYPSRVAIQMLVELYGQYSEQFGLQAKSATTNSLTKKSKPMLSSMCKKYDDLNNVDKAQSLIGKVDEVKVQMQDNIAAMLKNTEQAETLAERSDALNEQASVFKKKSTDLRKQMRCKNLKMTLILVFLIGGILAIILVPLIMKAKNK